MNNILSEKEQTRQEQKRKDVKNWMDKLKEKGEDEFLSRLTINI